MNEKFYYNTSTTDSVPDGLLTRMDMFSRESTWLQYYLLERLTLWNINDKVV